MIKAIKSHSRAILLTVLYVLRCLFRRILPKVINNAVRELKNSEANADINKQVIYTGSHVDVDDMQTGFGLDKADGCKPLTYSLSNYSYTESAVYQLKDVQFYWMGGSVFVKNGAIVPRLTVPHYSKLYRRKVLQPNFVAFPGHTVLLNAEFSYNFYHWVMDQMPLVHLLERFGLDMSSVDTILIWGKGSAFQVQYLQSLGLPDDKVRFIDETCAYSFEKLTLPHTNLSMNPPRWKIDFLQERFPVLARDTRASWPARIFISRQNAGRNITNYPAVEALIKRYQLTVIQLEDYSVAEQRSLFHYATFISGVHGAGYANLAWCQPDTTVLEIIPENYKWPFFYLEAKAAGLHYHYMMSPSEQGQLGNVQVDIEQLEKNLHALVELGSV